MVDDLAYLTVNLTSDIKYSSFNDPTNPFFFIINLALGGQFPKRTPEDGFPARFEIDWVRVWQQPEMGHVKTPQWADEARIGGIGEGQQDKQRDLSGLKTRSLNKHERAQ